MLPKPILLLIIGIGLLALIPPTVIAHARTNLKKKPRVHLIQDMDNMHRFGPQQVNPLFADGRAMRLPVDGTVARGELGIDDHYHRGYTWGFDPATQQRLPQFVNTFPPQVTVDMTLLSRGRERFNIYCTPCHGQSGHGDGIVHVRAMELLNVPTMNNGTTWVAPKSLHEQAIREQPVGQVYNTITNGVRNMAGYAAQVSTEDRWAIVAYVKALQRSQHALPTDVPEERRNMLPEERVEGLPVLDAAGTEDSS